MRLRLHVLPYIGTRPIGSFTPTHVRAWMRKKGFLFCRKGQVREIMRPIPIPGDSGAIRYGLCDGLHRDDHELIPA